ncbi:MAG: hypothetical protein IKD18_02010 [Clostridia bacterium]|nr:hypothetical protein [Clostridia bacterium]
MAGNGNEFLPNYVEHIVPLKEAKLVLPKKIALICGAVLLVMAIIVLMVLFPAVGGLGAIFFILTAYVIWLLWRFVSIEFEYTIHQGEISFDIVYGRRQRKHYYTAKLARVEKIAPLQNGQVPQADLQGVNKTVFCATKKTSPFARYAVVHEEDGTKTLLYFEIMEKAEKVLRFYNSRAFFGQN